MAEPALTGIHHINFTVVDPERSAAWYKRVFGLEHGWEMADEVGRGRKIILLVPGSKLRIVLTQHAKNDGRPFTEFHTGLDHVALGVTDRSDLDAWVQRLDSLHVAHSEVKEGATGWLVTLRDPDNIQLELYTAAK